MAVRDPNTSSNYNEWRTRHITAKLRIDFEKQRLAGNVELELESLTDAASGKIVLDSSNVDVQTVRLAAAQADFTIQAASGPNGSPLTVAVPKGVPKGERVRLSMDVATTKDCTALQWLSAEQTSNGKHPYMFSQCQAIHARSIFPCQDTPDVKSTISFLISSPLTVIASGIPEGEGEAVESAESVPGEKRYRFEQKVPIPTYLFALASGDIATAKIGPRSVVATGPDRLAAAQWEFEADMERYMEVAEKLVFPYRWGQYNVLVLPPSFPYGGMENPVYTFATPSLISGDRQNVDVIAHELSHSWSGNLVTNCSWEHFWLNEGWTMYLERRICAGVHGEAEFDFSAIIGWKSLEDAIERYGSDHEYTKLIVKLEGADPDDAFSTVPYEKGFHFLYYLDRLVGRPLWDRFIPHYFEKWSGKSLDSFEFKQTFIDFFAALEGEDPSLRQKVAGIDWEGWFYNPGLPPKPDFDTSLVDECYALAKKWESSSYEPSSGDIAKFTSNQQLVFLEKVQKFDPPLSPERAQKLGATYHFAASQNVELSSAYYLLALRSGDKTALDGAAELVGSVGRMKYVRPLYRALDSVDPDLARATFWKHEGFYHPICRNIVMKDLGLDPK